MFEYQRAEQVPLLSQGYQLFRLLGGAAVLIPVSGPIDNHELNLFAAKPDRIEMLSALELALPQVPNASEDLDYKAILDAYQLWRSVGALQERCAALYSAYLSMRALCARDSCLEHLSTFARLAFEWGAKDESVAALTAICERMIQGTIILNKPFLFASARYDDLSSVSLGERFAAAVAEQRERTASFTSKFGGQSRALEWLQTLPHASSEIVRRHTLLAADHDEMPMVPQRLRVQAHDHVNSELWCAGLVPGTRA